MIITKHRIRNIDPYLYHIPNGAKIVVGVSDTGRFSSLLNKIGFSDPYSKGSSILPSGTFGPVSLYNAEGRDKIHRDRPMEKVYREAEWHWTEFHGPYHRVPRSKIVDIPYNRYPRTFMPPPAVELTLTENSTGQVLLTSPVYENKPENKEALTHTVNLFLEIFGECQFFTDNLDAILKIPINRLNWDIFPRGEVPWEKLERHLAPLVNQAPKGNQPVITHRLETINKYKPDFIAVGKGGFHGYVIHGFTKINVYILESIYYGNATYIFDNDWEDLSKMTKAQILNGSLQKARIIHREGWINAIRKMLKEAEVDKNGK